MNIAYVPGPVSCGNNLVMIDTIEDIFKLCLVDEDIAEAIQVTSALCV